MHYLYEGSHLSLMLQKFQPNIFDILIGDIVGMLSPVSSRIIEEGILASRFCISTS
jgi:hypothetical protein